MNVVVDTSTLVSALLWPGVPHHLPLELFRDDPRDSR